MLHSELGPSRAHRYRYCAGSVNAERHLPDDAGIEAAQGNVFHEYADMCLTFGFDPHHFVGGPYEHDKFGMLYFDQEMADNMYYGLDQLRDLAAEPGAKFYVERKVDLSRWLGVGEFGTSDAGVINRKKRKITIFDWKYGMIPVIAAWNDQEILYTLGFWNDVAEELFEGVNPKDIEVDLIIEQPRAPGGGGVWHTTMDVILREGKKIARDAKATKDPDAPRTPGPKQCQFCRAARAGTCPEYVEWQLAGFGLSLDKINDLASEGKEPPAPVLTPTQRAWLVLNRPVFNRFMDEQHAASYDAARKGHADPGLKMVDGRSPAREWIDEEKEKPILERAFGEDAYIKKLRSAPQVEALVGKKVFAEKFKRHIRQGDPKPILVPVSDKRDAIPDIGSKLDGLV